MLNDRKPRRKRFPQWYLYDWSMAPFASELAWSASLSQLIIHRLSLFIDDRQHKEILLKIEIASNRLFNQHQEFLDMNIFTVYSIQFLQHSSLCWQTVLCFLMIRNIGLFSSFPQTVSAGTRCVLPLLCARGAWWGLHVTSSLCIHRNSSNEFEPFACVVSKCGFFCSVYYAPILLPLLKKSGE